MKKKNLLFVSVVMFFTIFTNSCKDGIKQEKELGITTHEPITFFSKINEYRSVIAGNDTIPLHPFEIFNLLKYDREELGMYNYLFFNVVDTIQTLKCSYGFNNNSRDTIIKAKVPYNVVGFHDRRNTYANNDKDSSITLTLETEIGKLIRKVERNKTYKVIYGYKDDCEIKRIIPYGASSMDGYYIVDIISVNEKFKRELPQN